MAYVTIPLTTPIFGVSTEPEVVRDDGYTTEQTNFRCDRINKLVVRPSTHSVLGELTSGSLHERDVMWSQLVQALDYSQGYDKYMFCLFVSPVSDGVKITVITWKNSKWHRSHSFTRKWNGAELSMSIVDDLLYIYDAATNVRVVNKPNTSLFKNVSTLNVINAMNYKESITVSVTSGTATKAVTYTISGVVNNNYDKADSERAVDAITKALADLINKLGMSGVSAVAKGSTVCVSHASEHVSMELTAGRATVLAIFNSTTQSIDGLPKYARVGTVIRIQPDPQRTRGVYFVRATRVNADSTAAVDEVIWSETSDPESVWYFDKASTPVTIPLDGGEMSEVDWDARGVGDDTGNPIPNMVGNGIQHITETQGRLLVLSGDKAQLSKTNDHNQFWRNSATQQLVTDPIEIGATSSTSTLTYALEHNGQMLVFAVDAQFKLNSDEAMTPQNANLRMTNRTVMTGKAKPVSLGGKVVYPTSYGDSAGLREYWTEGETRQDASRAVTDKAVGYIKGNIRHIAADVNEDMLICITDDPDSQNAVYVCERQQVPFAEEVQFIPTWCKWVLPEYYVIRHMYTHDSQLWIMASGNQADKEDWFWLRLPLRPADTGVEDKLALDGLVTLDVLDGVAVIPDGAPWITGVTKVFAGAGADNVLLELDVQREGNFLKILDRMVSTRYEVHMGIPISAKYTPTRPYVRDSEGVAVTTDPLYLIHWNMTVRDVYKLVCTHESTVFPVDEEEFVAMNNWSWAEFEDVQLYSGDVRFQAMYETGEAVATFSTNSGYRMSVLATECSGRMNSTRRR